MDHLLDKSKWTGPDSETPTATYSVEIETREKGKDWQWIRVTGYLNVDDPVKDAINTIRRGPHKFQTRGHRNLILKGEPK